MMVRVHILGGPGSGKTTLAQSLSTRFGVPHYDLDQVGWKNGDNSAAYIEDALAIAAQPSWITEGVFLIWTDPLLYAANYIVLLEISWPVAARRIIFRHVSKSLRRVNPYPGINGIKLLFKLLKDTRGYYLNKNSPASMTADAMYLYLAEQEDVTEAPQADRLLTRLEKYWAVIPFTQEFVRSYLEKYGKKVIAVKTKSDVKRLLTLITQIQEKSKRVT